MPIAALLLAAALALWPAPRPGPADGRRHTGSARLREVVVAAAGMLATGFLLGVEVWWSVPAAVLAGVLVHRRPVRRTPAQERSDRRLLAECSDLVAACVAAGQPMGRAVGVVARLLAGRAAPRAPGVTGPLDTLVSVAALTDMGASAEIAWRAAESDDDLAPLAAAVCRSELGGAALAGAVREHADRLRARGIQDLERSAGRAGVLITGPLTVCFLPAFLCLGLAPVVLGLLRGLSVF
ncbi:type II secretion system F family protein [Nakamurella alba]|nr:type II secretion system F family protein [Nakamurella alba]